MSPYIALPQNSDEAIDAQESKLPGLQQPLCHFRKNLARSYHVMLHILVVLQSTLLFMAYTEQQELKLHMLPSELSNNFIAFAKEAIQYEEVTFDPSGFWNDHSRATPYEGPPSPQLDAAWKRLVRVGMYSLTKQEYEQLNLETAVVPDHEDERIITLEVFHQLHCLNHIRQRAYGIDIYEPTERGKQKHLVHCVDYLRQVLMCHGDLTPITLSFNETNNRLDPNFRIKHTCRNFDKIWQFAAKGNRSGLSIEG